MGKSMSHMDILKMLPKTNCRDCGVPTCLAFAVAVFQGRKNLADCPHLPEENRVDVTPADDAHRKVAETNRQMMEEMMNQLRTTDLPAAARRLGLTMKDELVAIPCLSKTFFVGPNGIVSSCHVNQWLTGPLVNYVLHGAGVKPEGRWVPLRELPGGEDWYRLFGQRCEKPLKQVMDGDTDLFEMVIDIFDGKPASDMFESDIAAVIHPLPHIPILLCYWKPDDGMEASFNMFFDATATRNLPIESLYTLGAGLTTMFEKISRTHGK